MNALLTELAPSVQKLIDARLDNIDRALLSTEISRYERRQIVSAVEDQIQELVARIDREEPTREDILRILASLDPPEAYGSGSMQPDNAAAYAGSRITKFASNPVAEPKGQILAIVSVVLGGLSMLAIPCLFLIDVFAFALSAILSFAAIVCGIISLCQLLSTHGKAIGKVLSILGIIAFPLSLVLMLMFYVALS